MLDAIDWKVFFEKTNRVEAILRTDPAAVYPQMDFETCDAYRKAVEASHGRTGRTEQEVAELAITLAANTRPTSAGPRRPLPHGRRRLALERRSAIAPAGSSGFVGCSRPTDDVGTWRRLRC